MMRFTVSAGLKAAYTRAAAQRRAGCLVVGPNPAFAKRLHGAGFEVNEVNIRATGVRAAARAIIWIATKG